MIDAFTSCGWRLKTVSRMAFRFARSGRFQKKLRGWPDNFKPSMGRPVFITSAIPWEAMIPICIKDAGMHNRGRYPMPAAFTDSISTGF